MRAYLPFFLLLLCLDRSVSANTETPSSISLDDATQTIIEQNKSKVLAAKTEWIEGKEIHIIKVLTADGRVQFFKIDAGTGKIVK